MKWRLRGDVAGILGWGGGGGLMKNPGGIALREINRDTDMYTLQWN